MTEWFEFIIFMAMGVHFAGAGLYVALMLTVFGSGDRKEVILCLALLASGGTFIGVALRDAPFQIVVEDQAND